LHFYVFPTNQSAGASFYSFGEPLTNGVWCRFDIAELAPTNGGVVMSRVLGANTNALFTDRLAAPTGSEMSVTRGWRLTPYGRDTFSYAAMIVANWHFQYCTNRPP